MSEGTFVPRIECPGGHFFQGDNYSSDNSTKEDMPIKTASVQNV